MPPAVASMSSVIETVKKMADEQNKLKGVIEKMGNVNYNAQATMARPQETPSGLRPSGQRWLKGVGMGEYLVGLTKAMGAPNAVETEIMMKRLGSTKAALAESGGMTGGYTVPPEYSSKLLTLAIEESIMWSQALTVPMSTATIQMPALDVTTRQSAGDTPFLGGVHANWTSEGGLRTETEPQFRQVELRAYELSGYTIASNSLIQDQGVGMDALLSQLFTQCIGWYGDYAFLQGNGSGRPLGIYNSSATVQVKAATAGQFSYADVCGMFGALLPQSYKKAVWVINPSAIQYLFQMKDAANNNIFFPRPIDPNHVGPIGSEPQFTLLGRPVFVSEKVPYMQTGTGVKQGVALIDPSLYLIGMRMEIEVASSAHYRFPNNQIVWRFVSRFDGRPWLDNSVRLADGNTVLSPFVILVNP